MAERAFGVFAITVDSLLSDMPASRGHPSGDAWFGAAPKELRGSLLAAKPGMSFGGDGGGSAWYAIAQLVQKLELRVWAPTQTLSASVACSSELGV